MLVKAFIESSNNLVFISFNELELKSITPDKYLCCCGGGGLVAGTATYLKHKFPNLKTYAVEPENFDDTKISLEKGEITSNKNISTSICDAIFDWI